MTSLVLPRCGTTRNPASARRFCVRRASHAIGPPCLRALTSHPASTNVPFQPLPGPTGRLGFPVRRMSNPSVMRSRPVAFSFVAALFIGADLVVADRSLMDSHAHAPESVSTPLPPEYVIDPDGSVKLRLCFNWSCSRRENIAFTSDDLALLKRRMRICSGKSIHERLQQVRIGIWQMELLAQKYQPLLANDLAINDLDAAALGRMDCIDNSSNTTTYLSILRDVGALEGWSVSRPKVRKRFDVTAVHWTAVIIDEETGTPWSVDSWYRPNAHLPMVMPLQSWIAGKRAWEPPFERLNATPRSFRALCDAQGRRPSNHEGFSAH